MKIGKVMGLFTVLIVAFWIIACLSFSVFAAESKGAVAVNKEMEKEIGMPLLDGDLWVKMTHDDKVAFVWGIWHVVSIEGYLAGKYPQLKIENFSAKVVEAAEKEPSTVNELVGLVDTYYKTNPAEIEKPVVGVLWDDFIRPNIKTGIANHPLPPAK